MARGGEAPGPDTPSLLLNQRLWKKLPFNVGFLGKKDGGKDGRTREWIMREERTEQGTKEWKERGREASVIEGRRDEKEEKGRKKHETDGWMNGWREEGWREKGRMEWSEGISDWIYLPA